MADELKTAAYDQSGELFGDGSRYGTLVRHLGNDRWHHPGWQDGSRGEDEAGRAPNAEWGLMYRAGLSKARIAELVQTPGSTVGYHLRIAAAADPGLGSSGTRPPVRW